MPGCAKAIHRGPEWLVYQGVLGTLEKLQDKLGEILFHWFFGR